MFANRLLPALGLAATTGVILVVAASSASGHVTVSSPDAEAGGFGKLVFRVPTESDTASTVKLTVSLPTETPFAFVSSKVLPGWTATQQTEKLDKPIQVEGFTITEAVTGVTWTADKGVGIGPGEFDEFELSVGPFPDTTEPLVFPAVQTYSNGDVVNWDQPPAADGSEPEDPAPALSLGDDSGDEPAAGSDDQTSSPTVEATTTPPTESAATETVDDSATDSTARALGIGGLLLGAAGVIFGAIAWRRGGSGPKPGA